MMQGIAGPVLAALIAGAPAAAGPAPVGDIPARNYECTLSIAGREEQAVVFHDSGVLVIVVGALPRGFADKSGRGYLESFSADVVENGKEVTYAYPVEALDQKTRVDLQETFVRLVGVVAQAIRQDACTPVSHHE
jgi:hypothetical protein